MWDHENVHVISRYVGNCGRSYMYLLECRLSPIISESWQCQVVPRYIYSSNSTKDSTGRVQEMETMLSLSSMSHQSRLVAQTISL